MKKNNPTSQSPNKSDIDKVDLWKYFRSRGDIDKDRMLTITTWLLAFAAAILGYTINQWINFGQNQLITVSAADKVILYSAFGLAICFYTLFLVREFQNHARKNWLRSEELLELKDLSSVKQILDLKALKERNQQSRVIHDRELKSLAKRYRPTIDGPPPIFKSFRRIVYGIALLFILLILGVLIGPCLGVVTIAARGC